MKPLKLVFAAAVASLSLAACGTIAGAAVGGAPGAVIGNTPAMAMLKKAPRSELL